jgi:ferredoxin
MRYVVAIAKVDESKCTGCMICERICPTLSIKVGDDFLAHVDESTCVGCGACLDRCPQYAISLIPLEKSRLLQVDWRKVPYEKISEICEKAHHHPEEVICYCTGTRAREVAAAILMGADSPEKLSRMTGIRTGCKVECIQPILRLLNAAGIKPQKPPGYQWYGLTPTLWDLPEFIFTRNEYKKFYFQNDKEVIEKIVKVRRDE